jgi:N-acetylmuramoyl-L-alanine amidase
MTRENHDDLSSPFARNKKRDDMEKRRQIIEKAKPDLVISIHLNSLPSNRSVRGLQAFYARGSEPSRGYAEAIQNAFNRSGLPTNRRAATGEYFILECTAFPSVLVECGFLSNIEDEKLLRTTEYQRIVAHYIAVAIVNYFGSVSS